MLKYGTLFLAILLFGLGFALVGSRVRPSLYRGNLAQVVGIAASVTPNPYNTLDAQLRLKEETLSQKEQSLADEAERAASASRAEAERTGERFIMLVVILIGLVALNFYWDIRLARREKAFENEIKKTLHSDSAISG